MKWNIVTFTAIGVLLLDQTTKWLAQTYQPHNFFLTFTTNTGAAFGILNDQARILGIIGLLALGLLVYYIFHTKNPSLLLLISFGLLFGGIIGNTYDRLLYGHVIDFIKLPYWPVFNIADSATVLGILGIVYDSFKKKN